MVAPRPRTTRPRGWERVRELSTGFIDRSYAPCADSQPDAAKTGDLCWKTDNATLSFQGHSTQLVKDTKSGEWRARDDQGWRIRHLTGGDNGDNDGKYLGGHRPGGTRYYFGRERGSLATSPAPVRRAVPVFGDDASEPCHDPSFGSSWCQQAWRWNLDYVVDVHDNTVSYFYAQETNHYGLNDNAAQPGYVRGGHLTRIEYGQIAGFEDTAPASARVVFDTAERCIPQTGAGGFDCDPSN